MMEGMRTEWLLLENSAKELFLPTEIHHQVLFKKKEYFSKRCGVAGEVTIGVLSLACLGSPAVSRGAVLRAKGILNITRNQDIV